MRFFKKYILMLIIILPVLSGAFFAQLIKILLKLNKEKIKWSDLVAYSGMPSGHTAMVVSLVTILYLEEGWQSPVFGFSVIFAFLIIRDAIGLRRYLGEHGKVLNALLKDLSNDEVLEKHYPHLLEKIGHTPLQVFAGAILGFSVSLIGWILFK